MRWIPTFRLLLASLVAAFVLTGCNGGGSSSGTSGPGNQGGTFGGTMTGTLDGAAWSASLVTANTTGSFIAVGASDDDGLGFGFSFRGTDTGTYPIVLGDETSAVLSDDAGVWMAGGVVGGGQLVITSLGEGRVAGTFTFTLEAQQGQMPDERSMTSGTFDVEF